MQADVPLVIPEVNPDHFALIEQQCWRKKSGGYIVTNPNCSAIGLVVALAPLHQTFGVESLFVTTMQAVSGAGYPGVASLDILGNVIPFIKNEEEKMEEETKKLLGKLNSHSVAGRRLQHDGALQSSRGGRRAHRVGVSEIEAKGRRRSRSSLRSAISARSLTSWDVRWRRSSR